MPKNPKHCAISADRTGLTFKDLHRWMDEDNEGLGVNHRTKRHSYNKNDEKKIYDYWEKQGRGLGNKAIVEWLYHIALDNLETSFLIAKKTKAYRKAHNFFRFGWDTKKFIFFDNKYKDDEDLEEEFKDVYE